MKSRTWLIFGLCGIVFGFLTFIWDIIVMDKVRGITNYIILAVLFAITMGIFTYYRSRKQKKRLGK